MNVVYYAMVFTHGLMFTFNVCKAHHNNLFGSLPSSIGQWTRIATFQVSLVADSAGNNLCLNFAVAGQNQIYDNAFTGTLPDSLARWSDLSHFDIGMNSFSGTLPGYIGSSWTKMENFTVIGNMLTGTVPSSVGNWSNVRAVRLADNKFTGTLPDTMGAWQNFASFDASQWSLGVLRIVLFVILTLTGEFLFFRSLKICSLVPFLNPSVSGQL
jgi:hypothetical protein